MVLWEKQHELTLDNSIRSFLYTIVRNKSLNLLKKRKIEVAELDENFDVASQAISPLEIMQARETEAAIYELIDKLPPKCKQIFIMSRKEQMLNREIAAIMEINEKTVENQISIAIKFIKAGLNTKQNNGSGFKIVLFPWLIAWLVS